jgi:uncharacterized protein YggU (UPF0235/DUF167 family)
LSTSSSNPSPFIAAAGGLRIRVHARPGGRRDCVEGLRSEGDGGVAIKVTVRAAAEDGKANGAIVTLLAREWGLPQRALALLSGATDRRKSFHLAGDPVALLARLEGWLKKWTEQA